MDSRKPLVSTDRVAFGYGRTQVLKDVTLDVFPGELLGIAGPNGSGKTTLLRGLLGLIRPQSGSVALPQGSVGYVPQTETLDPLYPLSVTDVVCMGSFGRLRGWRRVSPADGEFAKSCLARVGLPEFGGKPYAELSGGQRQRVLIARALMVRPNVLILDEPTSGVDDGAAAEIMSLLTKLADQDGLGVVFVSHHLHLLHTYCTRAAWVQDGVVRVGPTGEVLRKTAPSSSGEQG